MSKYIVIYSSIVNNSFYSLFKRFNNLEEAYNFAVKNNGEVIKTAVLSVNIEESTDERDS